MLPSSDLHVLAVWSGEQHAQYKHRDRSLVSMTREKAHKSVLLSLPT